MAVRLGDVLVSLGALVEWQRDTIAAAQARTGRPFGVLAEEMFGVSPQAVERAWAVQYAQMAGRVDLETEPADEEVLPLIERRQAWQFQIVPLRMERGSLIAATSVDHLAKAMRFAGWALGGEVAFVLADQDQLVAKLAGAYPLPGGMDAVRRSA
jgi:hypothetical protein